MKFCHKILDTLDYHSVKTPEVSIVYILLVRFESVLGRDRQTGRQRQN